MKQVSICIESIESTSSFILVMRIFSSGYSQEPKPPSIKVSFPARCRFLRLGSRPHPSQVSDIGLQRMTATLPDHPVCVCVMWVCFHITPMPMGAAMWVRTRCRPLEIMWQRSGDHQGTVSELTAEVQCNQIDLVL